MKTRGQIQVEIRKRRASNGLDCFDDPHVQAAFNYAFIHSLDNVINSDLSEDQIEQKIKDHALYVEMVKMEDEALKWVLGGDDE